MFLTTNSTYLKEMKVFRLHIPSFVSLGNFVSVSQKVNPFLLNCQNKIAYNFPFFSFLISVDSVVMSLFLLLTQTCVLPFFFSWLTQQEVCQLYWVFQRTSFWFHYFSEFIFCLLLMDFALILIIYFHCLFWISFILILLVS